VPEAPLDEDSLAQLAHHLKNPLSAILGYAELLATRSDAELLREGPARIRQAARALSFALDDLLTVVALDAGLVSLELEPLPVGPAIEAALAEALELDAGRHALTASAGEALPPVRADAERLRRILADLLVHACRLAPPGSAVSLGATQEGRFVEVHVTTPGLVIPAEQLERLFDRFATDVGGLELFVARRLTELHGGTISATSGPEGSVLRVAIPLAE
jgi:signal transduction histidine kinase